MMVASGLLMVLLFQGNECLSSCEETWCSVAIGGPSPLGSQVGDHGFGFLGFVLAHAICSTEIDSWFWQRGFDSDKCKQHGGVGLGYVGNVL
jgi:hypothetical protein